MSRWPYEPLSLWCEHSSIEEMSRRVGFANRTVSRWKQAGLTTSAAESAAEALGANPAWIWPDWYQEAVEAEYKPCDTCDEPFIPVRRDQRFCTKACRWRWYSDYRDITSAKARFRERYHTDPEFRERRRQERKEYYWQVQRPARIRASSRRDDAGNPPKEEVA